MRADCEPEPYRSQGLVERDPYAQAHSSGAQSSVPCLRATRVEVLGERTFAGDAGSIEFLHLDHTPEPRHAPGAVEQREV
jgi:hypothetical protein